MSGRPRKRDLRPDPVIAPVKRKAPSLAARAAAKVAEAHLLDKLATAYARGEIDSRECKRLYREALWRD
jgi:hypothetical protein